MSLGVPQVRDAVHKATQPRQYAKPKTRVRATPAAEEGVQVATADSPCPSVTPFALNNLPVASTPVVVAVNSPPPDSPPAPLPRSPIILTPSGGGNPFTSNTPSVPEPETWVQLVMGFGVIGAVARVTYRRNESDSKEKPAVS